jgi:hypothetical protein
MVWYKTIIEKLRASGLFREVRVSFRSVGGLYSANSGVEPLGGFADAKDRLKPQLQQSKRIGPRF